MNNLLDRFKPKANALQNALRGPRSFQGTGQSLGGGDSHHVVIPIQLEETGPLGMGIERMKGSGGCIVRRVEDDSQAERAGIKRGDVVCFAGSHGKEEVKYADFLQLAKSRDRPLCFEVRRVKPVSGAGSKSGATPAPSAAGTPSGNRPQQPQSAEAFARKQAMIAAAEARDKANKAKLKPISRTTTASSGAAASAHSYDLPDNDPKSELSRAAIEAVKTQEAMTAAQLGYNPYVPNRATAGQARNATVAMTHGTISSGGAAATDSNDASSPTPAIAGGVPAPPHVRPPSNALAEADPDTAHADAPPPPELFEEALEVLVTSAVDAPGSLSTIHRLVLNATTKGQQLDNQDSGKFRRVRLANPKISAAIVDPPGALDLMLSCGFVLTETEDDNGNDNESVLVFPALSDAPLPAWLPEALKRMEALGRK